MTHFLDLSVVYDTSDSADNDLRLGRNGMLAFEIGPDGGMIMPGDNSGRKCGATARCFRTGNSCFQMHRSILNYSRHSVTVNIQLLDF